MKHGAAGHAKKRSRDCLFAQLGCEPERPVRARRQDRHAAHRQMSDEARGFRGETLRAAWKPRTGRSTLSNFLMQSQIVYDCAHFRVSRSAFNRASKTYFCTMFTGHTKVVFLLLCCAERGTLDMRRNCVLGGGGAEHGVSRSGQS